MLQGRFLTTISNHVHKTDVCDIRIHMVRNTYIKILYMFDFASPLRWLPLLMRWPKFSPRRCSKE